MNKLKMMSIIALTGMVAISCSDDDTVPQAGNNFVLSVVTDAANGAGLLMAKDAIPDSAVNPENRGFAMGQLRTTGYAYKDAIYNDTNDAGEPGIYKLKLENGQIVEDGEIPNARISAIKDENKGYYWNPDLSPKAIQIFNPSTMQRTGSIDLSSIVDQYAVEGTQNLSFENFMAVAGDKLYTQFTLTNQDRFTAYDSSFIAVINTGSDEFEKLIIYPQAYLFGYFGLKNGRYVSLGDDGYLYVSTWAALTATSFAFPRATILRIKAGDTEFDPNFEIRLDDFVGGPSLMLGGSTYSNGKLYTRLKTEPAAPDFSNITAQEIVPCEIDVASKEVRLLSGAPASTFGNTSCFSGPQVIQGKVYFPVSNPEFQGYYVSDPVAGGALKEVFSFQSGIPSNIFVLEDQ